MIDYEHDAPSFIWRIYDLISSDEVGKAEGLAYKVFEQIRERAQKEK